MSSTYDFRVYRNKVFWKSLNQDERYGCAATVWRIAISKLQYQGTGWKSTRGTETAIRAMYGCRVSGYRVEVGSGKDWWACQRALCPYCYSRRVVEMFSDLHRAFQKRPDPNAKIWITPFYIHDKPKAVLRRLRSIKMRTAAAAIMYHPTGETAQHGRWLIRGVLLTDDPRRVKGRKYKRRIYNSRGIAKALAGWMRYPVGWYRRGVVKTAGELVHVFDGLPKNTHLYAVYGACRGDFVPGSSRIDFIGNDRLIGSDSRLSTPSEDNPG